MKFLVRGKNKNFLEAELEKGEIKPIDVEVNPQSLVHFGTEPVTVYYNELGLNLPKGYLSKMNSLGIDYLFISREENCNYSLSGKNLVVITAYLRKKHFRNL